MQNCLNRDTDYYSILGASEDASPREIDRLYKRLAHKHHPDRGGADEDMKMLNEAYRVLHDESARKQYDALRRQPRIISPGNMSTPAAREVGVYGQLLSATLCLLLGVMLLLLVHFNGLWFLWPLSILAVGVILFGVMIAHSAMTNAREALVATHPANRFRPLQELLFWGIVGCGGYGIYLILTSV